MNQQEFDTIQEEFRNELEETSLPSESKTS